MYCYNASVAGRELAENENFIGKWDPKRPVRQWHDGISVQFSERRHQKIEEGYIIREYPKPNQSRLAQLVERVTSNLIM